MAGELRFLMKQFPYRTSSLQNPVLITKNRYWKNAKDKLEASITQVNQQELGFIVNEKRKNLLSSHVNLDYQSICKGLELRDGIKLPFWRKRPIFCYLAFGFCDIFGTSYLFGRHLDAVVNKIPDLPPCLVELSYYNFFASPIYLPIGFILLFANLDKITKPIIAEFIKDYDSI